MVKLGVCLAALFLADKHPRDKVAHLKIVAKYDNAMVLDQEIANWASQDLTTSYKALWLSSWMASVLRVGLINQKYADISDPKLSKAFTQAIASAFTLPWQLERALAVHLTSLAKSPDTTPLLHARIKYSHRPSEDEIRGLPVVKLLLERTEAQSTSMSPAVKVELAQLVDNLFSLSTSAERMETKNDVNVAADESYVPDDMNRLMFPWMSSLDWSNEFIELFGAEGSSRPHRMLQTILCYWGALTHYYAGDVWYFKDIGTKLFTDFVIVMKKKLETMHDWAEAMQVCAGLLEVDDDWSKFPMADGEE